jgi:serine/threonine protein phosphatase PrpC
MRLMRPTLRTAAGSDVGRRRPVNQDSALVSPRLLAVADGMGGHARGEIASTVAIAAVRDLDEQLAAADLGQVDLLAVLGDTVDEVARKLTDAAERDASLAGTGTTLVALLVDGVRIGVAHVGDSRAYLLRDGALHQLTRDHTFVQALVDEGRISSAQAAEHPRRSMLVRTLQEGHAADPDLFLHDGRSGDRYLVCSDGVTAVLSDMALLDILAGTPEPADAVARLIADANDGGGPDNITCIVADLVDAPVGGEAPSDDEVEPEPVVVLGAAADDPADPA